MAFCKYCGAPQDADALFCSDCGKQLQKPAKSRKKRAKTLPKRDVVVLTDPSYYETMMRRLVKYITPDAKSRNILLRFRIARYTYTIHVLTQFVLQNPNLITEAEWQRLEEFVARKYNMSSVSVFRQRTHPGAGRNELFETT